MKIGEMAALERDWEILICYIFAELKLSLMHMVGQSMLSAKVEHTDITRFTDER